MRRLLFLLPFLCAAAAPAAAESLTDCERGRISMAGKRYDQAAVDFTFCIEHGVLLPRNLAAAYVNRGIAFRQLGDLGRATYDFEAALAQVPTFAPAWNNRGAVRLLKGDFQGAIADFGTALLYNPDDTRALVNRGIALDRLGRFEEAMIEFDRAVRLSPGDPASRFNRASTLMQLGRYEEAAGDFTASLLARPNHAPSLRLAPAGALPGRDRGFQRGARVRPRLRPRLCAARQRVADAG